MNQAQSKDLQALLQCLAQDHSLVIVNWLSQNEAQIAVLAQALALSEVIVLERVKELHAVGLLQARMKDQQRLYVTNPKRIATLKHYLQAIDQPITEQAKVKDTDAWIDALDWSAEDKKILKEHIREGCLTHFPIKAKKWLPIVRWLASHFEQDKHYTEKEVNAILTPLYADYAETRRSLIDYGLMRRNTGGSEYWLVPENERISFDQ